jgi:meiotically up-regulated gene 157 (Mug157) protein
MTGASFPSCRPPPDSRRFASDAVEGLIADVTASITDAELAWLFGNCFPNTLDTTVAFTTDAGGRPDTFVITGDIDAMWLRDSTWQVWPYLPLVHGDPRLKQLFLGLIRRQAACVRLDPYANAFFAMPGRVSEWQGDQTTMRPGVHERKYELDSLCAVLHLACGYYRQTRDASAFDAEWLATARLIVATIRREQAGSDEQPASSYRFQRKTTTATDTLPNGGAGSPYRRTGMSRCAFRPSDDATVFQFHVPANAFAVASLKGLADVLRQAGLAPDLQTEAATLAGEIDRGLREHGVVRHPEYGHILAYEVDGFGSTCLMDDANVPSLLSLPYLGYCPIDDPLYQATRAFVLSATNPYFFKGACAEGTGGPHVGPGYVWPMSIALRGLTSQSDEEILQCLRWLKATHAGTGFMHESFWKDDASRFTRKWFAWANTVFGELICHLHRARPHVLKARL